MQFHVRAYKQLALLSHDDVFQCVLLLFLLSLELGCLLGPRRIKNVSKIPKRSSKNFLTSKCPRNAPTPANPRVFFSCGSLSGGGR